MREILLRPGESITIGDTVIKAEQHEVLPFKVWRGFDRTMPDIPAPYKGGWGPEPSKWLYDITCTAKGSGHE